MRLFTFAKIFLLNAFFINSHKAIAQNFIPDTSAETSSLHNAVNLYHRFLYPETGLYNGSEYVYNVYYPFIINQGDPFFQSNRFDTGVVFYNNVLYENVPLLYDIIKEELLIHDPTNDNIIRLNNERVGWFIISGHTFIRLNQDDTVSSAVHTGFYDLLYNGNTSFYERGLKIIKDDISMSGVLNRSVIESNEYFIKKDNRYYAVENKRSLLLIMNNKKKEVEQFIKKNKLNLRKNPEDALRKIVAYYDGITNDNIKAVNQ